MLLGRAQQRVEEFQGCCRRKTRSKGLSGGSHEATDAIGIGLEIIMGIEATSSFGEAITGWASN